MSSPQAPRPFNACIYALLVLTSLAGCAIPKHPERFDVKATECECPPDAVPVIRYGRFTLIEITPERSAVDLMHQVVDMTFPSPTTTVAEAINELLLKSGYRLCEQDAALQLIGDLPLPAVHSSLGPLPLSVALQTLVGGGWQLEVNDTLREVCFASKATGDELQSH